MKISKNAELSANSVSEADMKLINGYAKIELKPEDVFTFSVLLCDNERDRDDECFSTDSLYKLASLFIGKTGIEDHDWSSDKQVARIYKTEVVYDTDRKTGVGAVYACLRASAYMLRGEYNDRLIREIEGGIKKEVSVGCSIERRVCSICGENMGSCPHEKGKTYGGKTCVAYLENPLDAYEWSFVAVPAQKNAGVVKRFGVAGGISTLKELFSEYGDENLKREYAETEKYAELGRQYRKKLVSDTVSLGVKADMGFDREFLEKTFARLSETELLKFSEVFTAKIERDIPLTFQLPHGEKRDKKFSGEEFLV